MGRLVAALTVVAILSGCAPAPVADETLYGLAIRDAAWAAPEKVVPLRPLPQDGRVTVVSWTGTRDPLACADGGCGFPRAGATRSGDVTWVTLAPELRELCRGWTLSGPALTRRLEQVLGLPPGGKYPRVFVEFTVPRAALSRPCVAPAEDAQGRPICNPALAGTWQQADTAQTFAALTMASSYAVAGGYPFTRLGYTYDWSPGSRPDHYGASEFVVAPATPTTIERQMSADEYCL